jgi:hypothetical protein
LRRKDKEISELLEMEKILADSKIGILGMCEDGFAYSVPVNFVYHDKAVFFHSSGEGRKISLLKKSGSVSFLTFIEGGIIAKKPPCNLTQAYKSVMIEGEAFFVNDIGEKRTALVKLNKKYYPAKDYMSLEEEYLKNFQSTTGASLEVIKITIKSITGKSNAWG